MSDTPETDADFVAYGIPSGGNDLSKPAGEYVRRKHAEKLERERDDAFDRVFKACENLIRAALRGHPQSELWGERGLLAATMRCVGKIEDLERERDEALHTISCLKLELNAEKSNHQRDNKFLIEQRDEARQLADRYLNYWWTNHGRVPTGQSAAAKPLLPWESTTL